MTVLVFTSLVMHSLWLIIAFKNYSKQKISLLLINQSTDKVYHYYTVYSLMAKI